MVVEDELRSIHNSLIAKGCRYSANMCDFIELQTLGKGPHVTQSRINTSTVKIPQCTVVVSAVIFVIVFTAMLVTSIYVMYSTNKLAIAHTALEVSNKFHKSELEAHISTLHLNNVINNLQQEYIAKMNENISHSLFLRKDTLLELHHSTKIEILKTYNTTEMPFIDMEPETISTYRNHLSDNIDKSFVALSHEQASRRVFKNWKLTNETKEKIKKLYDEEFQVAVKSYEGKVPPEVSPEFHQHVSELTLSKGVVNEMVPLYPRVFSEVRKVLNTKYMKTLQDHIFIGIDLDENYITSFIWMNGSFETSARYETYVGYEEYDSKEDWELKKVSLSGDSGLPIFYDVKEIIRAWNSFNSTSYKLLWTFGVQEEPYGGPSVFSLKTGIEHPVKSVVSKLFQRVKETNSKMGYTNSTRCVITVPFDFSVDQRNLILEASTTAGFQHVFFLDEDVAAALTFQYVNGPWTVSKTIMLIELNRLSWKVYILEGHQSIYNRIVSEEYYVAEDVVNFCIEEYCKQVECEKDTFRYDGSTEARIRLRHRYQGCEDAIFSMSLNPPGSPFSESEVPMFSVRIYRNKTDEAIQKQVEHFTHFIDAVLRQEHVKLSKDQIDETIVGGKYGNIWVVKEGLQEYFNGRNLTINGYPSYPVAYGAAVKGLELAAEAIKESRLNGTAV